jgi:hypothetical protein
MANAYEHHPAVKIAGRIWTALAAFGFAAICFMCAATSGDEGDDVMCGSQEMDADDTCVTSVNGSSTERDYGEQADQNHSPFNQAAGVIGGILAIGFGLFALFGPDPGAGSSPAASSVARPHRRDAGDLTGGSVLPRTFLGRDIEVVVSASGISAWDTSPTGGSAQRIRRFRLAWSEIKALEYDRGPTGAVLALIAVGRDGARTRLFDAVQFSALGMQAIIAVIETYSDGRARMR